MDNFEIAKQHFLAGLQLLQVNNYRAAEKQFTRSLELLPDRVSTLNNLAAIKIKLSQFDEAEALARKAIGLEEKSLEAWSNLGTVLIATERHEEALEACDRALSHDPAHARTWLTKSRALLALKRYYEASLACDRAVALTPNEYEVLHTRSLVLKELGRTDEAKAAYLKSLEVRVASSPVLIAERRASQKLEGLIINQNPRYDDLLRTFETLHLHCGNYPGQFVDHLQEDVHFNYVFAGDAEKPSARKQIPQPDFVINNDANGELVLAGGNYLGLTALVDSFGVPVVNHPSKIVQTTRDASIKLLEGVSGVVIPKTIRFSSVGKTREALIQEIEAQYNYPLITRTLVAQEGKGMNRLDSRAALVEELSADYPKEFFVTQYVDSRGGNEFYRKIRAAIVQDELIIVRVDYDSHWNVHGRKSDERVAFYLKNPHVLREEERICQDPEAGLGRSAMQALRDIRGRMPLDVFGIDFDVAADGRVVFYEANATMNLFVTARKELPHPQVAEDRLKRAFLSYFASLAARR